MSATNSTETLDKSFLFKKKDPNAVTTIYFDNTRYKWSNVYAYVYDESSGSVVQNEKWPGKQMTYNSELGLYAYEVEDELTNGLVIFNAGSDANKYPQGANAKGLDISETNMVLMAGDKWEPYTGQKPSETPTNPAEMITVYFDNSSKNFSTPYIYYWHSSTNSGDIAWPGVAMTPYKGNVYKASFPSDNDKCIFSNNGGNQTGDLSIPGKNMIYDGNEWKEYSDAETPTATSPTSASGATVPSGDTYYFGDSNEDGKVNINDVTAIQFHLVNIKKLSALGEILANIDYDTKVSIKDANTIQCMLVGINPRENRVNEPYNVQQPTETTPTETQPAKRLVYFRNVYNWSPMKAYFWSDENKNMMSWPGNDMVQVSGNVFSAEVPDGATKVIFTEGSWRSQTGDLTIPDTTMIFDIQANSWSDYTG